jgi:hypothetical protein
MLAPKFNAQYAHVARNQVLPQTQSWLGMTILNGAQKSAQLRVAGARIAHQLSQPHQQN